MNDAERNYQPGDRVWAKTTSGREVPCTVVTQCDLSFPVGSYELDSPELGYAIVRHFSEIELMNPNRRQAAEGGDVE